VVEHVPAHRSVHRWLRLEEKPQCIVPIEAQESEHGLHGRVALLPLARLLEEAPGRPRFPSTGRGEGGNFPERLAEPRSEREGFRPGGAIELRRDACDLGSPCLDLPGEGRTARRLGRQKHGREEKAAPDET
jgi:hypothetical protein